MLIAVGVILLAAVHGHVAFVDATAAGLILFAAGLARLWLPVPDKRALLLRQFRRVMGYLAWDSATAPAARSPLTDLLKDQAGADDPELAESRPGQRRTQR